MDENALINQAEAVLRSLPKGSTVRLDNDSWQALRKGWDQAPWMLSGEDVDPDVEEAHWEAHTVDAECCHEPPAVALIPALLRMVGLRVDFS